MSTGVKMIPCLRIENLKNPYPIPRHIYSPSMGALLRGEIVAPPRGRYFVFSKCMLSLYSKLARVFSELTNLVMGLLGESNRQLDWGILQTCLKNWNQLISTHQCLLETVKLNLCNFLHLCTREPCLWDLSITRTSINSIINYRDLLHAKSAPVIKFSTNTFYHFRTQQVFPRYLAKFQSITTIRAHFFLDLCNSENLRPPYISLVPSWLRIRVNDVLFSKTQHGLKL